MSNSWKERSTDQTQEKRREKTTCVFTKTLFLNQCSLVVRAGIAWSMWKIFEIHVCKYLHFFAFIGQQTQNERTPKVPSLNGTGDSAVTVVCALTIQLSGQPILIFIYYLYA